MRKAERALEQILAEIQLGVWRPPSPSAGGENPTFHGFASRWWFARKSELQLTTQADYEWRLRKHLLPCFHAFQLSAITIALVDEYRSEQVIERERSKAAADAGRPIRDKRGQRRVALSNESINKTPVLSRTSSTPPSSTGCSRATRREAGVGGSRLIARLGDSAKLTSSPSRSRSPASSTACRGPIGESAGGRSSRSWRSPGGEPGGLRPAMALGRHCSSAPRYRAGQDGRRCPRSRPQPRGG